MIMMRNILGSISNLKRKYSTEEIDRQMDVLTRQNEVDILNDNDFSLKQIFVSSENNKAITESQHFVPCDTVKSESLAEMALLKKS